MCTWSCTAWAAYNTYLRKIDCSIDLPASFALPPSLKSVRLQLRPSEDTGGTLELGGFSSIQSLNVEVAVQDEVMPDDPYLRTWLLPGLQSLRRCRNLHI